mmetsp:Transcript_34206/g.89758  ORF Transcript_34206/g.89758 Transcript_34206/m.89758 type:complete len:104 (+) Transcript_34206:981-1292(+)
MTSEPTSTTMSKAANIVAAPPELEVSLASSMVFGKASSLVMTSATFSLLLTRLMAAQPLVRRGQQHNLWLSAVHSQHGPSQAAEKAHPRKAVLRLLWLCKVHL